MGLYVLWWAALKTTLKVRLGFTQSYSIVCQATIVVVGWPTMLTFPELPDHLTLHKEKSLTTLFWRVYKWLRMHYAFMMLKLGPSH